MKKALCTVVGICSCSLLFVQAERIQCGGVVIPGTKRRVDSYVCPTRFHRDTENRCCDPPQFNCCREPTFFEKHSTALVSSALIAATATITLLSVVCLCWEKCLFHKVVRRKPTLDYIARPEETEHLNGVSVPSEYSGEKRAYEVNSDIVYRVSKESL